MQTAAMTNLGGIGALPTAATVQAQAPQAPAPFAGALESALGGVDGLEQQAASAVDGLIRGSGVDLHEAMIATQKADMAFELALAVRNKAVAAYQQVMGMQF